MNITYIRMNEEEMNLFESYSRLHGVSLTETFKSALLEKIEDEFDAKDLAEEISKLSGNDKTHSVSDLRKEYNL